MITQEELAKKIKLVTQDAWKVGTNTSLNDMVEYIVRESMVILLKELEELQNIVDLTVEGLEHGSKNGRIQKPKRDTKAPTRANRSETREIAH